MNNDINAIAHGENLPELDKYEPKHQTLCWKCRNAVPQGKYRCSWSLTIGKIPVKGAEMKGRRVISCPEFIRG